MIYFTVLTSKRVSTHSRLEAAELAEARKHIGLKVSTHSRLEAAEYGVE